MVKKDIISTEMLEKLGIYELRELARGIGVPSPTTKKRKELCDNILRISKGEQKAEIRKNKKGRPPKSVSKITSFISDFIPEEILKIQTLPENNLDVLALAQNTVMLQSGEGKQVYGFINSANKHLYLKNLKHSTEFKDMIFYIPDEISKKYSLRDGDKILANGKIAESSYCGIIEEILKLNNEEIGAYDTLKVREAQDLSRIEIPSIEEKFLNKTIKKGERILTYFSNQEEGIVKVLEELDEVEDNLVFVGVELAPEIIYYIKSKKKVESFTTSFYNTLEESYETITNALNHSISLLKEGKSVKFVVFDIIGILSRLNLYYASEEGKYLGYSVSAIQMLKKLIGAGQTFSKELQLTTISIAFNSEKELDIIKIELEKIFSRIFM